jgi:hypothetical protein
MRPVMPNVRAKVDPTVWRAGTAAQNWGEAPAPPAQCATPLGLSLSEGLGLSFGIELEQRIRALLFIVLTIR